MKVVLIYLPHPYLKVPDAQAPLGLMYIAAVLEQQNIEVELLNCTGLTVYGAIGALPEADLFGITATSLEVPAANRFSWLIKEKFPESKIVLGGPGTLAPEYIDRHVIDSICMGDGETAIFDILKDMPNLNGEYIGKPVENLDILPYPARHLLKGRQGGRIFAEFQEHDKGESTVVLTSRGCPYKCAFCAAPELTKHCGKTRLRSPKSVYREMKSVIDEYGITNFRFSDDVFTLNKKRLSEICELVGSLGVTWRISCRVNPFDKEIAQMLKDGGCSDVSFGTESFDSSVLKIMNKGVTVEDNIKAFQIAGKVGLDTRVLFMVKTPGQSTGTMMLNLLALKTFVYSVVTCKTYIPLPGSDIWLHPQSYGIRIVNRDLEDCNYYMFGPEGLRKSPRMITINGRNMDEVDAETEEFIATLMKTGKMNEG